MNVAGTKSGCLLGRPWMNFFDYIQLMFSPYSFPIGASASKVFVVFVVSLALMHFVFLRLWPLGKQGWRKADYWWLAFAALGLVGGPGQVRQFIASSASTQADAMVAGRYEAAIRLATSYTSDPGPLCVTFVRGPFSPPLDEFDRRQRQHDEGCAWIKQLVATLPEAPPKNVLPETLIGHPANLTDAAIVNMLGDVRDSFVYFNDALRQRAVLSTMERPSELELAVMMVSPILLSLALALRITKVSGELKLDRGSATP